MSELAAEIRVSKSVLLKLVKDGKLPGYRFVQQWRFRREDVDAFIAASRVPPGTISIAPRNRTPRQEPAAEPVDPSKPVRLVPSHQRMG